MARKRGGLAGVWDRNKHIIKPVATAGGFLVGGPGGAAAANGLMSGFDRKGKGGVGFDAGAGAGGAIKGYLGGMAANGLLGAAGGLNAGAGANGGMGALRDMFGRGGLGEVAKGIGDNAMTWAGGAGNAVKGVGRWAMKDPKNLMALGQTAVGGLNAYGQAQQNNMMNAQTQLQQQRAAEQQRIRQLLMPYFQEYLASAGGGR